MTREHQPRKQRIIDVNKLVKPTGRKFFTQAQIVEALERQRHGILPPLPPRTQLPIQSDTYLEKAFRSIKRR